jgi:hypothetical protein
MKKSLLALASLTLLLSACGKGDSITVDNDILETQTVKTTMKNGKDLIDPVHGKEASLWYGAVLGTNGTNANGIAYVHRFEDGASILTVNENILQAEKGEYYSVSLKNASGTEKDAGKLTSIVGDARHSVKFETKENVDGFTTVAIYKNGSSGRTLVAEGMLKQAPK